MKGKSVAVLCGGLAFAAATVAPLTAEAVELKCATNAPEESVWGKVFTVWATKLKEQSSITLTWYFGGNQGSEGETHDKMELGQLDCAAVTSNGLGRIYKDAVVLQMPGLFRDWDTLDTARNALMPEMQAGMRKAGYYFAGAGDVGWGRTQSTDGEIRTPEDLRKATGVYQSDHDPIGPVIASVLGYTAVRTSIMGVGPMLASGKITVMTVPALASTQLQWADKVKFIMDEEAATVVGGLVVKLDSIECTTLKSGQQSKGCSLSESDREAFKKTGAKAGELLTKRIRDKDDDAFDYMKRKATVTKLGPGERAKWRSWFKKVRRELGQGTFSQALVDRVEGLAGI